jgi:tetratricopeptide (TPR) repeat protein
MDPEVDELVNQALTMVENGNLVRGESMLSDLLKKHPDLHTVQYAMGVLCAMKGDYDQSIVYFDRAIEIFPYFAEAWFNKGIYYRKTMNVAGAIKAFQEVVALGDPAENYVGQAKDFLIGVKKQIYQDNGLSLEEYLKSDDMFEKAFATMQNGEYEKAIDEFKTVVEINKNSPPSYGNLGICYGCLGKKEEALAAFDKALELDPKYEPAILNKTLFSATDEGYELPKPSQILSVDYYKDYPLEKKSLIGSFLELPHTKIGQQ